MSRRTATLSVAGILLVLLAAVAALLPVPYVILSPGPTADTIGSDKGKELITISGRTTYPVEGDLLLTTVYSTGGPGRHVDLGTAIASWLDDDDAVVPTDAVYERGTTREQVKEQNTQEMQLSQESATAAALSSLGIPVTTQVKVSSVTKGAPATGRLEAGDVVTAVDGTPVVTGDQLRAAVGKRTPGESVQVSITRGGTARTVAVPTRADQGRPVMGITVSVTYKFPFEVKYSLDRVGGPSAGAMFALGIVDKLTPGAMTGGLRFAGTGSIDGEGTIGSIGGIQQKLSAAKDAGATVFLAPAPNCAEALRALPDGLRLVKITTLADARTSVEKLAKGQTDVPSCAS